MIMEKTWHDDLIIPRWLGHPLYMGGVPVRPENHSLEDTSVRDLYLKYGQGVKLSELALKFIKDYLIYYAPAPVWMRDEFIKQDLNSMSIDQLFDLLLDWGLDPL